MAKEKNRQTPGQARSRPGKIARKAAKQARLKEEAGRLGITVSELQRRQSLEAASIVTKRETIVPRLRSREYDW